MQPRSIVFLGPPGSGKGTQAARLSSALELPSISTGEILRQECQSGSELGKRLETALRRGELIGDEQMNEIVQARIRRKDCKGGCILDGFPRTVEQAKYLDRLVEALGISRPIVFNFCVSGEELIERLNGRKQCPACGRVYSSEFSPSGRGLFCHNDRTLLVTRADDKPAAIRERLRIYERNVAGLLAYYKGHVCHNLLAGAMPDEVSDQIFESLGLGCISPRSLPDAHRYSLAAC